MSAQLSNAAAAVQKAVTDSSAAVQKAVNERMPAVKDAINSGASAAQQALSSVMPGTAAAAKSSDDSSKLSATGDKPIVVVCGVTGQQGGSVARYLLKSGKWQVRGLTRDLKGEKAMKMQSELPALQLFQADMLDGAALRPALTGAKALFLVTDFYTDKNLDKAEHGVSGELEEGLSVLKIAKELNIEYVLVSSLVNAEDVTHGKWKVLHFSGKQQIEEASKEMGLKTIGIYPGQFMQNFSSGLFPKIEVHNDGSIEWRLPLRYDVGQPLIDIEQLGIIISAVLEEPERWVGRRVLAASEYLTMEQAAAVYSDLTGVPVTYKRITMDAYRKENAELPYLEEYVEQFSWFNEFGYYGGESLRATQRDFPHTNTFREWLVSSGWRTNLGAMGEAKKAVGLGAKLEPQNVFGSKVTDQQATSDATKEKLEFELAARGVQKAQV